MIPLKEMTLTLSDIQYDAAKVCERLDAEMKRIKMSRRELARQINIPPSTFQSIMERKGDFSAQSLFRIREVLKFDPTEGMIGKQFIFQDEVEKEIEFNLLCAWRAASEDDRLVISALMKKYGFIYPMEKELIDNGEHQED